MKSVSRVLRKWLIGTGLFFGLAALGIYWVSQRLGPGARVQVVQLLEQRFNANVELRSLQVSVFPTPHVTGAGLELRHKDWVASDHPLIAIRKFTADTNLSSLFGAVKSVRLVRLEGLEIHIPPRGRTALKTGLTGTPHPANADDIGNHFPFVIERIVADGTLLEIEPTVEGKLPLDFEITSLTLQSVGVNQPMAFQAELTNPEPPGLIRSTGSFGPWDKNAPRETAVSGKYTFGNADLSVFKGISGILSSVGNYHGALERIEAEGTTDTPDFTVATGGHSVDLKTSFSAVIDGTNGDTLLQPVEAHFLNSVLECRGGVTGTPGVKGKTISLDVSTVHARIEDLVRLTVKADKPLLTGAVSLKTAFMLPPGPERVMDKLQLAGQFGVNNAKFTSRNVEEKITRLSLRAQGKAKEAADQIDDETVASNFKGKFSLKNGQMNFSQLSFAVPGAVVNLDGYYSLKSEEMDFHGTLRMDARISQTQTGIKSIFLKAVDPFFAKDGAGAVIPIKISGTRSQPSFGLELRRKRDEPK